MAFDYDDLADLATELLTEFGQNVTRRSYTAGTYDPATGATTPATADTTRIGALFDYDDQSRQGQQYIRNTLVIAGDKQLLLDPTADVDPKDHFIAGGAEYTIVSLAEVNPAGTRVLYDIHLRKA